MADGAPASCPGAGMGCRGKSVCVCGGVVGGPRATHSASGCTKAAFHCCGPQDSRPLLAVTHGRLDLLGCLYNQPQKLFSIRRGVSLWSGQCKNFQTPLPALWQHLSQHHFFLKHMHPLHVHFIENHIFIYICMSIF